MTSPPVFSGLSRCLLSEWINESVWEWKYTTSQNRSILPRLCFQSLIDVVQANPLWNGCPNSGKVRKSFFSKPETLKWFSQTQVTTASFLNCIRTFWWVYLRIYYFMSQTKLEHLYKMWWLSSRDINFLSFSFRYHVYLFFFFLVYEPFHEKNKFTSDLFFPFEVENKALLRPKGGKCHFFKLSLPTLLNKKRALRKLAWLFSSAAVPLWWYSSRHLEEAF